MPVRQVSNRGGNVIGKFPSIKMGRMIAFESLLERDFVYLLDYDPAVEWFEEQPVTIEYVSEDKVLSYTPDFHLIEGQRNVLIECKPDQFVDTEENRPKFAAARAWCAHQGWEFRIVTDQQVRAGFRLQNVKLLTRYARQVVGPVIQGQIFALLHDAKTQLTISGLAGEIAPDDLARGTASVLHLAFHHKICLQLDEMPLVQETLVQLAPQTRQEDQT
ncbi:MAG: hypothetical protein GY832_01355 [Chloroflexi bacterium]|nr:hypothetical protein [Chloroflexota bacterium]